MYAQGLLSLSSPSSPLWTSALYLWEGIKKGLSGAESWTVALSMGARRGTEAGEEDDGEEGGEVRGHSMWHGRREGSERAEAKSGLPARQSGQRRWDRRVACWFRAQCPKDAFVDRQGVGGRPDRIWRCVG